MFEALWLIWEMMVLAALLFFVTLALFLFWLFIQWRDEWRYQEPPVAHHEQAHLWPKE
jgi:hypothetical protein